MLLVCTFCCSLSSNLNKQCQMRRVYYKLTISRLDGCVCVVLNCLFNKLKKKEKEEEKCEYWWSVFNSSLFYNHINQKQQAPHLAETELVYWNNKRIAYMYFNINLFYLELQGTVIYNWPPLPWDTQSHFFLYYYFLKPIIFAHNSHLISLSRKLTYCVQWIFSISIRYIIFS